MRQQQQIWQEEHVTAKSLPSEMEKASTSQPSSYVVQFIEFLKEKGVTKGTAIDIGAGKGRNSVFLAEQGFEVHAVDYIQSAVDHIQEVAEQKHLSNLFTHCAPIDSTWNFSDHFFDLAIDNFSSIDIETKAGRERYRHELLRTLKPQGYALVVVVSTDDEIEAELLKTSPGPEVHSTIWPATGKFQKNYDEHELREFYKDFRIISLQKISKPNHKLGRDYVSANLMLILQKK